MARHPFLFVALLLASGLAAQQQHVLIIHFPLDEAEPVADDIAALNALCDRPDIMQVTSITLKGHTDVRGDLAYNEALSRRRTTRVHELLSNSCLRAKPIKVEWSGELEPLTRHTDDPAHARNRRVEVVLTYPDELEMARKWDAHSHVTPLIHALDKPRERHRVDARAPIDQCMSDGVRVRIPAGAIVDAQGRTVDGPVELSYRSFSEPYEIIASGIPMHVQAGGYVEHFETAGMYELYASLNGEPLSLVPGAEITLERPIGTALGEDFRGWELDPNSGNWIPRGTLTTLNGNSNVAPSVTTEATALYWQRLWALEAEKRPDSTSFDDRRKAANYCHLTACDTAASGTSWIKKRDRFADEAHVPEIRVVAYKGMYLPDRVVFTLEFDGNDDKQFPEWRRLSYPAVWEYEGPGSRAVFKRLYGRRHLFQDVHLMMEEGKDVGVLRLKENGEWLELPVNSRWNRTKAYTAARWAKGIAMYNKSLDKRRTNFDRQVERRHARYKRDHVNLEATAWKQARRGMNEAERDMDLAAWMSYAETRRPIMIRTNATMQRDLASVQTTFGLQGFGVYNIDRIMKLTNQLNVLAATEGPDGRPFPWVNGFAVLKNENAVITYWGNGSGKGDSFLVSPGKMKSLFLVDADGKITRADVAPLNSREDRVVLQVFPLNDPKSIDELRAQASR